MDLNLDHYIDLFNQEPGGEMACGKAFDGIYGAFQKAIDTCKPDYDYLALHLYAFLGSWKMLHYRSCLTQRNYKVLKGVVEVLFERAHDKRFKHLVNFIPNEKYKESYKADILALRDDIIDALAKNFDGENIHISDTMIGKILLGTFACMPAFDSNFCIAAGEVFNKRSITIENTIDKVFDIALKYKPELESLQNGYPIMKVVDMVFWAKGNEIKNT